MFFARSSLSVLLAIIAFFTLALSVSALPVPIMGAGSAAPGTLLGRTYSRKTEGVMISRSPSPEPDVLEDEPVELLSRDERFHRRTQLSRRNIARHAASANLLMRRAPEPKANTIQLVAKRGL
ncbi:hypothetical protein BKA70DRAFT_1214943 [Coprinopsis sp. MPI-PUGE-AT-0042]|nr:hypothetical protein BKA70DRAFT_1214943 [Coprinopsis sp. MPI-PUGE-AT-0042]